MIACARHQCPENSDPGPEIHDPEPLTKEDLMDSAGQTGSWLSMSPEVTLGLQYGPAADGAP